MGKRKTDETAGESEGGVPLIGLLHRAAAGMRAEFGRRLQSLGVTLHHFLVLMALAKEGPCSQLEAGGAALINRSRMVGLLDDLERLGLAERRRDPDDRRVYVVHLTEAGRAALARAQEQRVAVETRWLEPLPPAERPRFLRQLAQLAAVGDADPCSEMECPES
jgi:DNA-binding MarR family transcriptional regulator